MHLPAASTQHLPAISPLSAHIEMEVIVMGGVIIRAEHRSKTLAGAVVDDLKETPRPVIAVPVVLDRDPAAICQHKGRDIDSIAMRMFGQVSGHIAVHFSAGIGAIGFNAYQLAAQDQARGWLGAVARSEEHTSELQSLMRISYAV